MQFWLVSIDANEDTVCVVELGHGRSQSIDRKRKSEFSCSDWPKCISKWGPVWEFNLRFLPVCEMPCWQMTIRLLFIKFWTLFDHEESISADNFFLGLHTKWIFLPKVLEMNRHYACPCVWESHIADVERITQKRLYPCGLWNMFYGLWFSRGGHFSMAKSQTWNRFWVKQNIINAYLTK